VVAGTAVVTVAGTEAAVEVSEAEIIITVITITDTTIITEEVAVFQ